MDRWTGRVALVTGASKGIGAATASMLVKHGMKVYACARNISPIELAADSLKDESGQLHPVQCNLQNEKEIVDMFKRISAENGCVHVMINNAGLSYPGQLLTMKTEQMKEMLDVNVLALSVCNREAVKGMKEQGVDDGHIINVNSTAGHRVSSKPVLHFYSATKFAVTALTQGLRSELQQSKSKIKVTSLSPGVCDTSVHENYATEEEKAAIFKSVGEAMQPDDVANAVITVLSTPPNIQVQEFKVTPIFQG